MRRPTPAEIDDEIVDQAAALFARHGYKDTSVQRIADAAGYSKTGLLHRFPSKEALWQAVSEHCAETVREVFDQAEGTPIGPSRDRVVLVALAGIAVRRPGLIALVLSAFSQMTEPGESALLDDVGETLLGAFGLADSWPEVTDLERCTRVVGALGALAVAALSLRHLPGDEVHDHLVAVSYDALGHPRPAGH
ncbi:TetR/AcrR family transcriptional regulator [Actinoplanes sp. N902-109]|uniref:TetR/AcrR family transcriptional regulator n=1 Tax=Actinoplanes sp. (strain N902-109) TaxID=649831 RepID=UPI0003296282|nr:TetR/AcrR family transcriptional regulator [Actinoplanes sp. N902-109]AGL17819.1 TetR family transcriptional regulator [Actinoplanes sp. N902-109]